VVFRNKIQAIVAESKDNRLRGPTRKQIRTTIDNAEKTFQRCWATLVSLKTLEGLNGASILDFQPNLAAELFNLDNAYRQLIRRRRILIGRKAFCAQTWFRKRMRALDQDLNALRTCMRLGRTLGDVFAWAFYRFDQPLLERHLKHPANPHTPPGIGGRGELEFIRRARPNGFLPLYHGVTTFLRIGDVSFFNLSKGRVSAIGELKSRSIAPGELALSVHIVSDNKEKIPFLDLGREITDKQKIAELSGSFSGVKSQVERQMKKAAEALRPVTVSGNSDLRNAFHINELADFASQLCTQGLSFKQVGKGLLLAGSEPYRGKSLSSRIFSKVSPAFVLRRMKRAKEHVIGIFDPALHDNGMLCSELDNNVRLGLPPLFWLPCDIDFLEKVYFLRAIVATVYNPAHLFNALRERGYEITSNWPINGPPRFEIRKAVRAGAAGVEQFNFFVGLIQHRFMREEAIIESFEHGLTELHKLIQLHGLNSGQSARLELSFVHML